MSIKCPKCGSDRVQSFEAVYAAGASTFSARSSASDALVGHVDTYGQSSTKQAQLCAPPSKAMTWKGGLGILGIGWIIGLIMLVTKLDQTTFGALFLSVEFILAIVGGIWVTVRGIRFNKSVFPGLVAAWQRMWLCQTCNNRFEVQ